MGARSLSRSSPSLGHSKRPLDRRQGFFVVDLAMRMIEAGPKRFFKGDETKATDYGRRSAHISRQT